MSIKEYENGIKSQDYNFRFSIAEQLSIIVSNKFKENSLGLSPIRFFSHYDGLSRKKREIGIESPMQQVMVYIAIGAMSPMLNAKICPYQCASIKGRGQIYGKRAIEKWVRTDKSTKYWAKADIRKCFPSIKKEVVMNLLKRDIHKNPKLLWLVDELLSTYIEKDKNGEYHECGLIIGSYLSQWLCNYVLSYLYRYMDSLCKIRKSNRDGDHSTRLIHHVLFYMDDILVLGSRATDVRSCMRQAKKWAKENLGLDFKDGFDIVNDIHYRKIDMMGYVIGLKCTTIRKSIFLRINRQFIRAEVYYRKNKHLTLHRARAIVSYYGFLKHSNSFRYCKKRKVQQIVERAKKDIAYYAKLGIYYDKFQYLGDDIVYVA